MFYISLITPQLLKGQSHIHTLALPGVVCPRRSSLMRDLSPVTNGGAHDKHVVSLALIMQTSLWHYAAV